MKKPETIIKKLTKDFSTDGNLKKSMQLVTAALCCVDGIVDQAEIDKVNELGKKFFKDKYDKNEFETLVKGFLSTIDFSSENEEIVSQREKIINVTATIMKQYAKNSLDDKIAYYSFLSEVALSDGEIHEKELDFLNLVSEYLEIKDPFDLKSIASNKSNPNKVISSIQIESDELRNNSSQAIGMLAKMLTDSMIHSGQVPKARERDCLRVAIMSIAKHPTLSADLVSNDERKRVAACLFFMSEIEKELGLGQPGSQFSSTVYADTNEELVKKKRAVNIYASLGLLCISGFLGSFGYAIYQFFTNGNFLVWIIIGVILWFLQRWVGSKHDALTG